MVEQLRGIGSSDIGARWGRLALFTSCGFMSLTGPERPRLGRCVLCTLLGIDDDHPRTRLDLASRF